MILFFLLGAGAYVGWNIGANDTANCIGTTVGCGLISFKKAVALVAVFAVLGSMLQGGHVMKTIGRGIVHGDLNYTAIMVALICSGFFVTLATFFRIPTSTSQAIVGGVVGIGLAAGVQVNYSKFITIAGSWIVSPILVLTLAFLLSKALNWGLHKYRGNPMRVRSTLGWMAILSSCYLAYTMGANNAG
ncbi:MAG: inorganic phosphate transporter, partial [Deltaproteobacteria bacterium]